MRKLVTIGLLLFAAAWATSGASALTGARTYTAKIRASTTVRNVTLHGAGVNLQLRAVRVNGKDLTFADGGGSRTATMYGAGVIVRFTERHDGFRAAVVAITGHPVVQVSYNVSN
jgi:hypothetical protein